MITIPEDYIYLFNIAVIVIYVLFVMKGMHKGVLSQLLDLFGTLIAFFVSWRYSDIGSNFFSLVPKSILPFQDTLLAEDIYALANRTVWFLLLFIICKIIFHLLSKLFDGIQKVPGLKEISSLLGGLFGFFSATIWIIVICTVLKMPVFTNGQVIYNHSMLSNINETAVQAVNMLGVSTDTSDLFNDIYLKVKDMPDNDKEAVTKWLEGQGYKSN